MVMVTEDVNGKPLPCKIHVDGYVKQVLDDLRGYVVRDWDGIGLYVGYEGDGKSVCAMGQALYLDHKFNLDKIVFTADQFHKAVDDADEQTVILWDEADELGSNWASTILLSLKRKMKRIRKKNLYILLVTPTVFDLNKYFVIHRTRYLFHIYAKGFERGKVRFFNRDRKKELYLRGRKEWNMSVAKPNFLAGFPKLPKDFPIDMDAYDKKKDEATVEAIEENTPKQMLMSLRRLVLGNLIKIFEKEGVEKNNQWFADAFDTSKDTIRRDINAISAKVSEKARLRKQIEEELLEEMRVKK